MVRSRLRRTAVVLLALGAASGTWGFPMFTAGDLRLFGTGFASVGTEIGKGGLRMVQTLGGPQIEPLSGGGITLVGGTVNAARTAALVLDEAHAFPTPFRPDLGHRFITFTKLTTQSTIRIYTLSGTLVATLNKSDGGDILKWDVRNDRGEDVASGPYFFFVENNGGETLKGTVVVIR